MSKLVALFITLLLIQWTSSRLIHPNSQKARVYKPLKDAGDPLFLTPYIQNNTLEEGRLAAKVELDLFQNVTSYSGYLTVDGDVDANLFFWFFPSEGNQDDPVVLWLQGGPGGTSMFGLFVENGPFAVDDGDVSLRDMSWTKNQSVLYIDQPVGTGFSFTNGDFVTNQTQVAEHLYSALTQFFTLFPEYQENEFYISGESYAGKYVPAIGYAIHQNNPSADLKINLQGLIIVDGLSDPIHQMMYGDLLYQTGLIDRSMYELFQNEEKFVRDFIESEDFSMATDFWNELIGTYLPMFSELENVYNFLKEVDDSPTDWQSFVNQDEVRQALHVGNTEFLYENYDVYNSLYADITKSVAPWVSELLSHYRMVILNGQLDIIVGYPSTVNYLQNLNFSSADVYATASRSIWTVNDQVAGYVKVAGNLTEVLVRNAGHMVPMDQPAFAIDLITKFVRNLNIA